MLRATRLLFVVISFSSRRGRKETLHITSLGKYKRLAPNGGIIRRNEASYTIFIRIYNATPLHIRP